MIRTIRHGIEYYVVLLFFGLVRLTPQRLTPALARCLGGLSRIVTRNRVKIALANLRAALPERSESEHHDIVRQVYINLAGNAIDSVRPLKLLKKIEISDATEQRLREIEETSESGRSVIFISGHLGDWELLAQYLATRFPGLAILAKTQHNRSVDRLINELREITGGKIIPSQQAPRLLTPIFKQGGAVYMVSDQDAGSEGITVEFLGLPTSYARGLALYSYHYNAPLIPVFLYRRNPGFSLEIEPPIEPNIATAKDTEIVRLLTEYSAALERRVLGAAGQWLWTHRRWKSTVDMNI